MGAEHGFEAACQVHDVRCLARSTELHVAYDQGWKGATLTFQDAHVKQEMPNRKNHSPQGREWRKPRANPCGALSRASGM